MMTLSCPKVFSLTHLWLKTVVCLFLIVSLPLAFGQLEEEPSPPSVSDTPIRDTDSASEDLASEDLASEDLASDIASDTSPAPTYATTYATTNAPLPERLGNHGVYVNIADQPQWGDPTTTLVLVEFSDFNCTFCGHYHTHIWPELKRQYLDSGQLRYVYRDVLGPGGDVSFVLSVATECAREQISHEAFYTLIQDLYALKGMKNTIGMLDLLIPQNIDEEALITCLTDKRYVPEVELDVAEAYDAGIRGTPGFIIGWARPDGRVEGARLQGALPTNVFQNYIQMFLESAPE